MSGLGAFTVALTIHQHLIRCGTTARFLAVTDLFSTIRHRKILVDIERRPFSKTSSSLMRQHRSMRQRRWENLDVPHPDGGGVQPQIEMGPFFDGNFLHVTGRNMQ